jgi:general secretion pathway protein G
MSLPNRARRPRLRGRAGFTLIEILVVLVVIAILASLVAPNVFKNVGQAKQTTAKAQIETLSAALDSYRLDNGSYPSTQQGLDALWQLPAIDPPANWRGPYLKKPVPMDPWTRPYLYLAPGEVNFNGFDLFSYGADALPGPCFYGDTGCGSEDGDVVSWK